MKKLSFVAIFLVSSILGWAQKPANQSVKPDGDAVVIMETSMGEIVLKLYGETPIHRDNFLKLAQDRVYDGLLFHRVIKNFMIQAGDPKSREAKPGQPLGDGTLGYTLPAEFRPNLFHKRGALCAARQGDNVNPKKESSASQFYIVQGNRWDEKQLDMMSERMGKHRKAARGSSRQCKGRGTPGRGGDFFRQCYFIPEVTL